MSGADYMMSLLVIIMAVIVGVPLFLRFITRFNVSEISFRGIFRVALTLACLFIIFMVLLVMLG